MYIFHFLIYGLLCLNFLAFLVCIILRFRMVFLASSYVKNKQTVLENTVQTNTKITTVQSNLENSFVSIHIPTHSEPPHIVLRALKSLVSLSYPNYEVIVFDNNTSERELWLPLREFCQKHSDKFKFVHAMGVKDYKAGALNLAYQYIDKRTSHIMVIDADYCLDKNVLEKALSHFENKFESGKENSKKIGLVQFPQSYYNATSQNLPLKSEYQHFFDVYMQAANQLDCVLCTGTMSIFSKQCLEDIGLWSGESITEDVEMGIKMHQNNYKGVFVNQSLGKGLMPTDLKGLRTQRKRWVYGNMQTLLTFFKNSNGFSFSQLTGIFSILTAWFSFLFIPIITLFLGAVSYAFTASLFALIIVKFSLVSIGIEFIFKTFFLYFSCSCEDDTKSIKQKLACFAVHFGMVWETSIAWWLCIFGLPLGFERTNKFFKKDSHSCLIPNFVLLVLFGAIFLMLTLAELYVLAGCVLLVATPFCAVFYLFEMMNYTQKYTAKILPSSSTTVSYSK